MANTPNRSQFVSMLSDTQIMSEIRARAETEEGLPKAKQWSVGGDAIRALVSPTEAAGPRQPAAPMTEAIILLFGRPALLVRNGTFEIPRADAWKARLYPTKARIEQAIRSVGRVEVLDHPSYDWVGTAWVVADNVVVTNRHVAQLFAEKRGKTFNFSLNPEGRAIRARVDFKEEYKENVSFETTVEKVLFIEAEGSARPDLAIMRLKSAANLPSPVILSTTKRAAGAYVGVIGYPARDPRNDADALTQVFGDIYNVKRFSPGTITKYDGNFIFTHDCSTLGGNSGSVVIDVETGEGIGLHFGGQFQHANYAVKAEKIAAALRRLKVVVPKAAPKPVQESVSWLEAPATVGEYDGREGYDPKFLGAAAKHRVPFPTLTKKNQADAAKVNGKSGTTKPNRLHYEHFSLVLNRPRRMAFYTAVNVDGSELRVIPRGDRWRLDPRVAKTAQAGPDVYSNNDLDRGHLVRRLDPVWGDKATAGLANDDTFHFTNAAPQHKDFNQKIWNDLEEYLLGNAGVHELRISVFTGPIFRSSDEQYRSVRLPTQFWKVVAMVKEDDDALSVTAYVLSQADLLTDLEFVFGQFRTYQVPLGYIEKHTGLRFGKLKTYDPLAREEAVGGIRVLSGVEDIRV